MMDLDSIELHKKIKDDIYQLRFSGKTEEAIKVCEKASKDYPDSYAYPKICGDLYASIAQYREAGNFYYEFLLRLKCNRRLFNDFANRYFRLKKYFSKLELTEYAKRILRSAKENILDPQISQWCYDLVQSDVDQQIFYSDDGKALIAIIDNDHHFNDFVAIAKRIEEKDRYELVLILDEHILGRDRKENTFRIDAHCISIYERLKHFRKALKVAIEISAIKKDSIVIRSVFRICRYLNDYSEAEFLLAKYPYILKEYDFNILYELVYYHEHNNDMEMLQNTLNLISKGGKDSIPIQKTLRNFYFSYGLLDEAEKTEKVIEDLYAGKSGKAEKFSDTIKESELGVGSKIKELYSDVEHHRSLAAISDLTTGISHELGQPITNIRYTVQFYQRQFEKKITKEKVFSVFDSILIETKRMGDLVKRLSPLTSSRNMVEEFDVVGRINQRLMAFNDKLVQNKISVMFGNTKPVIIIGDPIHFDQILNNLILNAIDAIRSKKIYKGRKIKIRIAKEKEYLFFTFTDSGVGIRSKNRGKIYDPFFTTKPPGKGEGLGLFIIWNLLKMHGGQIRLDPNYKEGAKFDIKIPIVSKFKKEISNE